MTNPITSTASDAEIVGLPENQVHVWFLPLDGLHGTDIGSDEITLSPEEERQANDFVVEADRQTYLTYRRALRGVLGFYTGLNPATLPFSETPEGKPYLDGHAIEFNVSHTKKNALIAITRSRAVGIDVEEIQLDFPHLETANSHFSAGETEWLRSLPENARARAFLRLWCARQAALKATGTGRTETANDSTVDLARNYAHLHQTSSATPTRVHLQEIHLGPESVAYLAHLGATPLEVSIHDFRRIAE